MRIPGAFWTVSLNDTCTHPVLHGFSPSVAWVRIPGQGCLFPEAQAIFHLCSPLSFLPALMLAFPSHLCFFTLHTSSCSGFQKAGSHLCPSTSCAHITSAHPSDECYLVPQSLGFFSLPTSGSKLGVFLLNLLCALAATRDNREL